MTSDIAIVHKHYPERGGAEVVADELARTFDGAPVYTGVANPDAVADGVDVRELFGDSRLARILRRPSMPWQAIRDFYYLFGWDYQPDLAEYDVLVQSGMAPFWYVPRVDDQVVVRYVHSSPRMPYDRYQDVGASRFVRWYSRVARTLLPKTVPYADQYVANSELVARRLERYLGIPTADIEVVYPPVETDVEFAEGGDYYIGLSRLTRAKGWRDVIDAFGYINEELRIVGDGADRRTFERQARNADNIQFEGHVDEGEKWALLREAKALVYNARDEDFGMVPIEAMAAGTPVIGVDEGFTAYQIHDGANGLLFERGVPSLHRAIRRFERDGVAWRPVELHQFAQRFSARRFRRRMREVVEAARAEAPPEPPWDFDSPPEVKDGLDERAVATDGGGA